MVGAIPHRALYIIQPCQELFCIVNDKTIGFCIVNNGIMNSGIVGALVYRVLYIIQPCQEYFISSGLIYSPFLYSK